MATPAVHTTFDTQKSTNLISSEVVTKSPPPQGLSADMHGPYCPVNLWLGHHLTHYNMLCFNPPVCLNLLLLSLSFLATRDRNYPKEGALLLVNNVQTMVLHAQVLYLSLIDAITFINEMQVFICDNSNFINNPLYTSMYIQEVSK